MIDPANVPTNRVAPPVHIDRIRANGTEFGSREKAVAQPGKGELEFHFTAPSFIAPQNVRFRCRLEGYDKDWMETGHRRLALYTNLKPGRYAFRVIAANADGIWNTTGDSVEIQLLPHFYQTAWFYLLCGAFAAGALAGGYGWRVRQLTRKQRALQAAHDLLETRVEERTPIWPKPTPRSRMKSRSASEWNWKSNVCFGLHSGALAAREMGGTLQVLSEGVGRGASFTLQLPLKPYDEL